MPIYLDIGKRGTGKTKRAIEWSRQFDVVTVFSLDSHTNDEWNHTNANVKTLLCADDLQKYYDEFQLDIDKTQCLIIEANGLANMFHSWKYQDILERLNLLPIPIKFIFQSEQNVPSYFKDFSLLVRY